MKKQKFIKPVLIKAGDNRVKLGVSGTPPKVDCRVIAECGYQQLKKAYDMHYEMIEALQEVLKYFRPIADVKNECMQEDTISLIENIIKKETE